MPGFKIHYYEIHCLDDWNNNLKISNNFNAVILLFKMKNFSNEGNSIEATEFLKILNSLEFWITPSKHIYVILVSEKWFWSLCSDCNKSLAFTGIGLNVNNEKPTTSLNIVLRELYGGAYQFEKEDVLASFFNKFEKFYGLFVNQGTVLIIWLDWCCLWPG